jgi:hypothetical protein
LDYSGIRFHHFREYSHGMSSRPNLAYHAL